MQPRRDASLASPQMLWCDTVHSKRLLACVVRDLRTSHSYRKSRRFECFSCPDYVKHAGLRARAPTASTKATSDSADFRFTLLLLSSMTVLVFSRTVRLCHWWPRSTPDSTAAEVWACRTAILFRRYTPMPTNMDGNAISQPPTAINVQTPNQMPERITPVPLPTNSEGETKTTYLWTLRQVPCGSGRTWPPLWHHG